MLGAHGLLLVDLEWHREGRRRVLRLYVDKPGGVGVDDCQRVSHEVGDLLDASDLIAGSYDLEVSSPGLTRELRTEREWQWARGRRVRCWLAVALEGRTEIVGRLEEVTDRVVRLLGADGVPREVDRNRVKRARLDPDWSRQGAPGDA